MAVYRKQYADRHGDRKQTNEYHYDFRLNGRRYAGKTGHTQERKAKLWEKERKAELRQLTSVDRIYEAHRNNVAGDKTIAVDDAFDAFLVDIGRKKGCDQHVQTKRSHADDFFAFLKARYPEVIHLHTVDPDHAKNYVQQLQTSGRFIKPTTHKNDAKLSNRTVNIYITNLKQLFTRLGNAASITENPFAKADKLDLDTIARDTFDDADLDKIFANMDAFLEPLFRVALDTGLREADIALLRKDEIDIASGWLRRTTRKTGKVVEIPIYNAEFASYLKSAIDMTDGSVYAFPRLAEMYKTNRTGIQWRVHAFLAALEIEHRKTTGDRSRNSSTKGIHSLRHQFITRALQKGVALNIIQDIVGHSSGVVTREYAKHVKRVDKEREFRKLNGKAAPNAMAQIYKLAKSMTAKTWGKKREKIIQLMNA